MASHRPDPSSWTWSEDGAPAPEPEPRDAVLAPARFEVVRRLGEGSSGVVYEAVDLARGSRVALKTLHRLGGESLRQLKNEFRALQDLSHPNLIALDELVEHEGQWFLTMELLDGTDLGRWSRHAAAGFDAGRARAAFGQLAQALAALHAAGKVHRDVKPSNVLVTPSGRVVLLDLGLVSEADAGPEGRIVGTVRYMAPEQAARGRVTAAADWYAFGVLLYEALVGQTPFPGTPSAVLEAKARLDPAVPRLPDDGLPEDLASLCDALLSRDPGARPTDAEVLARLGVPATGAAGLPFVGRDAELARLHAAMGRIGSGAHALMVRGDPGIGKTALLRRFTAELAARGDLVLRSRCFERESVPFRAVDGLIDAVSDHGVAHPGAIREPAHASLLVQAFPVLARVRGFGGLAPAPPLDPVEQRVRVFAGVKDLFARLARAGPLVLVIEDLQWADADSLALLTELLRGDDAPPALLVATARPELAPPPFVGEVLDLQALPADQALDLVRRLAPDRDGDRIVAEAGGNPLFLAEMARSTEVSARLEDAVWARVQALDPDARALVETLALAGAPVPTRAALAASGAAIDAAPRLLGELRRDHLVRLAGAGSEERAECWHDRIRETVAARMPEAQRRDGHGRLAHALEAAGADPEALADHFGAAGDRERALGYGVLAARAAQASLAVDRAARLWRRVLELAPDGADAGGYAVQLATCLAVAGRGKEAGQAFLDAAARFSRPESTRLEARAAEELMHGGAIDEGVAVMGRVLAAVDMSLPATPLRAIPGLLWRRARIRLRGLGFTERPDADDEAVARIDACWSVASGFAVVDTIRGADFQARNLLLALDRGEPFRVARAVAMEGCYAGTAGRSGRAYTDTVLAEAHRLAAKVGHPNALGLAHHATGVAAFCEGDWPTTVRACDQAMVHYLESTRQTWEISDARLFSMCALTMMGSWPELMRRLPAARAAAEQRGNLWAMTNYGLGTMALDALLADDPGLLRRRQAELIRTWSTEGFLVQHGFHLHGEVEADLHEGDGAAAVARIAATAAALRASMLEQLPVLRATFCDLRGRAAVAVGDRRTALREARRLAAEGMAWSTGAAALLEAGVAKRDGRDPLPHLGRAESAFGAGGMATHLAVARRWRAQLTGDHEAVAAVDAELRAAGVRSPERTARRLTPNAG